MLIPASGGRDPAPFPGTSALALSPYLETPSCAPRPPFLWTGELPVTLPLPGSSLTSSAHPGEPRKYIRTAESERDKAARRKRKRGRKVTERPLSILAPAQRESPESSLPATGRGATARNLALIPGPLASGASGCSRPAPISEVSLTCRGPEFFENFLYWVQRGNPPAAGRRSPAPGRWESGCDG